MSELANSRLVGVRRGKAAQPSGWPPKTTVGTANTLSPHPDIRQTISPVLSYDAQNRLTSVTSVPPPSASVSQTAANRAEFFYDSRNRCILRKYDTKGSQAQWVLNTTDSRALTYDNVWNLLTERTLDGKQVGEYIHGQRTDEILRAELTPQTQNPKSQTLYPLADGLGSTVALSDDQGRVTQRYRYTAYGTPTVLRSDYTLPATGSSLLGYRFLFTGREWLGSVGLNDHRNRYYSPNLGRWLTSDPIRFRGGDVNLNRYVFNSVTQLNDASGLATFSRNVAFTWSPSVDYVMDMGANATLWWDCDCVNGVNPNISNVRATMDPPNQIIGWLQDNLGISSIGGYSSSLDVQVQQVDISDSQNDQANIRQMSINLKLVDGGLGIYLSSLVNSITGAYVKFSWELNAVLGEVTQEVSCACPRCH